MCADGKAAFRPVDPLAEHPLYPDDTEKKKKPLTQTLGSNGYLEENTK
jgi:hypothetical protein